jgi:hypothetical protein
MLTVIVIWLAPINICKIIIIIVQFEIVDEYASLKPITCRVSHDHLLFDSIVIIWHYSHAWLQQIITLK